VEARNHQAFLRRLLRTHLVTDAFAGATTAAATTHFRGGSERGFRKAEILDAGRSLSQTPPGAEGCFTPTSAKRRGIGKPEMPSIHKLPRWGGTINIGCYQPMKINRRLFNLHFFSQSLTRQEGVKDQSLIEVGAQGHPR